MAEASPHLRRDTSRTATSQQQTGKFMLSTAQPRIHIQSLLEWLLFLPGPVELTLAAGKAAGCKEVKIVFGGTNGVREDGRATMEEPPWKK